MPAPKGSSWENLGWLATFTMPYMKGGPYIHASLIAYFGARTVDQVGRWTYRKQLWGNFHMHAELLASTQRVQATDHDVPDDLISMISSANSAT